MTQPNENPEVALIIGGGPGVSASCARLFSDEGMRVGIAARNPDKSVLQALQESHGVSRYACDAADPDAVAGLFDAVTSDLGSPTLVVHNIGRGPELEDMLFEYPITGHYRYYGSREHRDQTAEE